MLREQFVFLSECIRAFETTGAMFPTSRWAAKALSAPLRNHNRPMNILEAGPGTGSVTVAILPQLIDGDHLTICEINPRFMRELKARLAKNPDYIRRRNQVTFFEGPVQELPEDRKYDVVVCAIPFLNLPLEVTREIFAKFARMGTPETVLSYFEYMGMRSVGKVVAPSEKKARLRAFEDYFKQSLLPLRIARERVWLNILPIHVYQLRPAAA